MFGYDSASVITGRSGADADVSGDFRAEGREYLEAPLLVYEPSCPDNRGWVHNISEHGLGVVGVRARVNEIKRLVIQGDEAIPVEPCEVQAVCRWVRPYPLEDDLDAGFEIIAISQDNWDKLLSLVPSLEVDEKLRKEERHKVEPPMPIFEVGKQEQAGYVVDVSEHGFRVMGLPVKLGERKKFVFQLTDGESRQGIEVEAHCRWLKPRDPDEDFDAGFEIIEFRGDSFKKLVAMHSKRQLKY
uniref:PilZ domain-containing protein n=1 Tax=Desulfomonile tiedjei TaxID=2358 RepID=A0A7C4EVQ9_9BACT